MNFSRTSYDSYYAEIGQDLLVKMAFVIKKDANTYTNAFDFVQCRDFLGDALDALTTKTKNSIYGFTFNGQKQTFLNNKMTLVLSLPVDAVDIDTFKQNLERLNLIEKKLKLLQTKIVVEQTEGDFNYVVTTASKFWLKTIYNVSLYTFMLKCCAYNLDTKQDFFVAISNTFVTKKLYNGKLVKKNTVEADYARSILTKVDFIFKHIKKFTKLCTTNTHGFINKVNINTKHNNAGFVSLTNPTDWSDKNVISNYFIEHCKQESS